MIDARKKAKLKHYKKMFPPDVSKLTVDYYSDWDAGWDAAIQAAHDQICLTHQHLGGYILALKK